MTPSQILMLGTSAACLRAATALACHGFAVVRAGDVADVDVRRFAPALVIADSDVASGAERWQATPLILLAPIRHAEFAAGPCAELLSVPVADDVLLGAVRRQLAAA